MKKALSLVFVILMFANLNVDAADLEYTALYVGSSNAFVNDVEQQIDTENANVKVFDTFTYDEAVTDTTADAKKDIKVTAYAIQALGSDDATAAWEKIKN